LLLEIDVANPDGRLFDGMYAQAKFALKNPTPALLVPDNSILIDSKGPRVLVVDSSDKINVKPVTLGRDFGTKSEILGGLDATDRVAQNPTQAMHEGMIVSVEAPRTRPVISSAKSVSLWSDHRRLMAGSRIGRC
jgi:membrane fusion protein, multidrug efflux system